MIKDTTIRKLIGKTGKPFQYLIKRTWKIAIPIILILSFLERGIDEDTVFLSLLYALSTAVLTWYLPFKMVQFLEYFYQEPEKEYRTRRVFAVIFAYILYFIVLLGGMFVLMLAFRNYFQNNRMGIIVLYGVLMILSILVMIFTSLVPSLYWTNNDLTLWKSIKLSFKGMKEYYIKVFFFIVLSNIIIFSIFKFMPTEYFITFFRFVFYWLITFKFLIYWILFLYSSTFFYLLSRLTLGKDIDLAQGSEKTLEATETTILHGTANQDMNRLKMIVCVAENNLIGDKDPTGNGLLWHSKEELLYYKSITIGQVTLFGENTAKFVPLELMRKNREALVLTMDSKIEDILKQYPDKDVFLCGGATIYKYYLEHYPIAQVYVSKIKEHVEVGEAKNPLYFPNLEELGYKVVKETEYEDFIAYIYEKKDN